MVANGVISQNADSIDVDLLSPVPCDFSDAESATDRIVDQMPEYPGGVSGLYKFLGKNTRYPEVSREGGIEGKVYVEFVILKDGTPCDFVVVRGIGGGCDEEAIRVLKMMEKWKPGKQDGKPVNVRYTLPVNFTLN